MEISDDLRCLFSAHVEERDQSYIVEVPEQELSHGELTNEETYRVAILPTDADPTGTTDDTEREPEQEQGPSGPPVAEGDRCEVEIEDIGEQGDGIARVERGYIVIVPETKRGERVTIEITNVRENVAFATVVERQTHV